MISDLDETIRQLLIQGGGFDPAEVEISFDIPNREWSAGISKPSLNCYLFDIRENRELRMQGMEQASAGGRPVRQRPPLRYDLTYLVTAWTRAVEDEHKLLWHALHVLTRYETMPLEYLQGGLREHTEYPIPARTALPESVLKSPGEFWTALENQLKPSLSYIVTLTMNRDMIAAGPPVLSAILRYPWVGGVDERPSWFGGVVRNAKGEPIPNVRVEIEGRAMTATTDAQGRYRLRVPRPGTYTVIAHIEGQAKRHMIDIAEPNFDLQA